METRNEIDETVVFSTVFQMVGDSMDNGSKRGFTNGDYLICDQVDVRDIQIGYKYVIKVGNSYLVRQVASVEAGVITCAPLNSLYKNSQLCIDDIHQVFLIKSYQRKITDDETLNQKGGIR